MDQFEIVCNWFSEDEKKLNSLIACSPAQQKGIESVTAETCICLNPKNNENDNSPQKPEIKIRSKNPLKELNIYSEASLIEVFGVYNEYLCTCKAEFIDDWEGLAVYHANIGLPETTICTLKFTRMREKDRLWLYSIQPTTVKLHLSNHTLFNFQNIINLLSSNIQMSEKTEVKKIMENLISKKNYLKTSSISPQFGLPPATNVTNREYKHFKEDISKCFNSSEFLHPSENLNKHDITKNILENEYIINYIDKKFTEMKAELMNQIEINLAQLRDENNEKLDKMMKLLQNITI